MKANIPLPRLIIVVSLMSFFASCSTGNKVVSSFGKRKYTKGYYLASASNKKSAPSIGPSLKDEEINTCVSRNSSAQHIDIPVNGMKTPISSSTISAAAEEKKTIPAAIPEATNAVTIDKSRENVMPSPYGIPGHGAAAADADSSKYDNIATTAMLLMIAALLLLLGAIVFGSLLIPFIQPAFTLVYFIVIYLCVILATIFGFKGHKSERYRGRANFARIIGSIILLVSAIVLFFDLLAALFFE